MAPARIVVVGASAGGIDALSRLMSGLPADLSAPIVIGQHLDPRRASHLADILKRHGTPPVRVAVQGATLDDGVVFVIPPGHNVRIEDHRLELLNADAGTVAPSVDLLLSSAAKAYGAGVVAVILSGSGSDGSIGAADVRAAGGIVLIEDPATAAFPSMPASVTPDIVSEIAAIEGMADAIGRALTGDTRPTPPDDGELAAFFERLKQSTGTEFRDYKQPTIRRRLQGRMDATNQPTIHTYAAYVEEHPAEQQRLFGHLLVKVTEFFRDQTLFAVLTDSVLPELIADAERGARELRIWSAGCSTGEEGYSLGIAALEALATAGSGVEVRIFGTDLDPEAIAVARRGRYSGAALEAVPRALRERYFVPAAGGFEVVKSLRSRVVFGEHDLAQRAPFPRIDLVVCQNVLIYFTPALQRVALETFAYSLRAGGILALGASETAGALPEPFAEERQRPRLYRRTDRRSTVPLGAVGVRAGLHRQPVRPSVDVAASTRVPAGTRPAPAIPGARADQLLLDLSVGVIVVDDRYLINRINTAARRLLGIHGTATGQDFIHLAEVFPSTTLRAVIDAALSGTASSATYEIESPDETAVETVFVTVRARPRRGPAPAPGRKAPVEGAVIELIDVSAAEREGRSRIRVEQRLEKSGASVRRLRRANEELTELVEQLRIQNDGLQVAGEDAQTGREELETLNEEFQATNEELETVNEELTASVDELRSTNEVLAARTAELKAQTAELEEAQRFSEEERGRLHSILASLGDAVVAVDPQGVTVATNPAYDRFLAAAAPEFAPQDFAGQPIPPDLWPQRRAARGEFVPHGIRASNRN